MEDRVPAGPPGRLCYRISTVAEVLDVSMSSVRRLIRGGKLDAVRIGDSIRVTEASLQALLASANPRPGGKAKK